jgi:competence protein ComEC
VIGQTLLKTTNPLLSVLKIGIYANLVALPILLEANKEWNILSIPANLFFVLFVEKCLFPASFLTVFLPSFAPLYQLFLRLFKSAVQFLAQWDTSLSFNFPSDWSKAVYFLLLLWLLVRVENKKAWIKPALCILLLCLFVFTFPTLPGVSFVKILDVGQGDAIYIHAGGADVLIDTGKSDDYDAVITYFLGENIHHLDRVIITHSDADHCGELLDLMQEIDIGAVVCGSYLAGVPESMSVLVKEGEEIRCNDLRLQVLSTNSNDADENDNSLVLYGEIGFQKWLFMGDAGTAVEERLMRVYTLSPDVIKIGHHGSDTSSSASFLFAVDPDYAVISVAKNNTYGHPAATVLKQLAKIEAEVYRTDECGTITFLYLPFGDWGMITKNNPQKWIDNEIMRFVRFL